MRWYLHAFRNIFNYSGRARRAEFGWFYLINILISFGVTIAISILAGGAGLLGYSNGNMSGNFFAGIGIVAIIINVLWFIYGIASWLVVLSLTTRRLHDLGWSGWWQLLWYVFPCILAIWAIILTQAAYNGTVNQEAFYLQTAFLSGAIILYCLFILVISLILLFKDGQRFSNKYGADPKALGVNSAIEVAQQAVTNTEIIAKEANQENNQIIK